MSQHELPAVMAEIQAMEEIEAIKAEGMEVEVTMGLNGEFAPDDRVDTLGGQRVRRVPDALTVTKLEL